MKSFPLRSIMVVAAGLLAAASARAAEFEGKISAAVTTGAATTAWNYTYSKSHLRIEETGGSGPRALNLLDRTTGTLTLAFPHNRSVTRIPRSVEKPVEPAAPPGVPPVPPAAAVAFKATGETKELLGRRCEKQVISLGQEILEVWTTTGLPPFHAWLPFAPLPVGAPSGLEQLWPALLREKGLFPLHAVLTLQGGHERFRFVVKSIAPGPVSDPDGRLFAPPDGYVETRAPGGAQ